LRSICFPSRPRERKLFWPTHLFPPWSLARGVAKKKTLKKGIPFQATFLQWKKQSFSLKRQWTVYFISIFDSFSFLSFSLGHCSLLIMSVNVAFALLCRMGQKRRAFYSILSLFSLFAWKNKGCLCLLQERRQAATFVVPT